MIFINEGDAPLSVRQATKRGIQYVDRELGAAGARKGDQTIFGATAHADLPTRLLDVLTALPNAPATYSDYAAAWESDNVQNGINNLFNHQLAAYRNAVARLSKYRLADGREESIDTDEFGQTYTISAIKPLDAEVEQAVYDEDTGEQTGTEMVPNPLIVEDDAERVQAQIVVDNTPIAVLEYAEAN